MERGGGVIGVKPGFEAILKWSRQYRATLSGVVCVLLVALGPLLAQQIASRQTYPKTAMNAAELVRLRAEWFFRQRASTHGHVPGALLLRAFARNKKMIAAEGTFAERLGARDGVALAQDSWTALGPQPTSNTMFYGNVSGRVTALAVDPCDATGNTVYAGGADGGVWVSFNALSGSPVTWQPLTDDQPSLATGALALVSSSCQMIDGHLQSSEILVGTGESNYALENIYGAGVLRSMDGGQTWTQDATFTASASQGPGASGPYIAALAAQPHQANPVILAAVQGTDFAAGGALLSGVWRSTDGGNHWTRAQPDGGGATGAPCDFSFGTVTPASPGGTANYKFALQTMGATGSAVQLTCSIPLAGATCAFTPNPATPVAGGTSVAVAVTVPATASVRNFYGVGRFAWFRSAARAWEWEIALSMIFAIFGLAAAMDSERRRRATIAICCAGVIILVNMMAACGGGGGGGGPQPQTYEITITGASGSFQHLTSVQVVVD